MEEEENEITEGIDELSVPQYQIKLENIDFEYKQLKAQLFMLEQEHTRNQINLNSKIESAKRDLIKPMKDLQEVKNRKNRSKEMEREKENIISQTSSKGKEKIQKLENKLEMLIEDENQKYEIKSMIENDISSTEVEIKKMEKEITDLDKKTETIAKTYPSIFKKLTDDFNLFDKKSRMEINIKEINNKIKMEINKIKYFEDIKSQMKVKSPNSEEIKYKIDEKIKDIDNLVTFISGEANKILQIENYFEFLDSCYENVVTIETIKSLIIPFFKQMLEKYEQFKLEQSENIIDIENEIQDLYDTIPLTKEIKKKAESKENELKNEKSYLDYINLLINECEKVLGKCKPYESKTENDLLDSDIEYEIIEDIKEIILKSVEDKKKEEVRQNFEEYIEIKTMLRASTNWNNEYNDVVKGYDDIIIRHKNQMEKFNRDKKIIQDELKALNDTINLRSKELKNVISQFKEEDFSQYFNLNKNLLKLILFKEKKSIVKNNQYELKKGTIQENVLIDHSRKKTNMYNNLKRKYLLEYYKHLYSQENLDSKGLKEKASKNHEEAQKKIKIMCKEMNNINENMNEVLKTISKQNDFGHKINNENKMIEELNSKIMNLQNNISILENQKSLEESEFNSKKNDLDEIISEKLQEISIIEEQVDSKLNVMTEGVINLYLKYDDNIKNYNPEVDKFIPNKFAYALREFNFDPTNSVLTIKDIKNNIIEKKISYDLIKRISVDPDSTKLVNEIESKFYNDERERKTDVIRKKRIKFFVTLRRKNLDLVAKNYNDYKRFADIINTIIIHK